MKVTSLHSPLVSSWAIIPCLRSRFDGAAATSEAKKSGAVIFILNMQMKKKTSVDKEGLTEKGDCGSTKMWSVCPYEVYDIEAEDDIDIKVYLETDFNIQKCKASASRFL
jgi:hypothetical protein